MKTNQFTGLFIIIFGVFTYFVLIPHGIKVPKNLDNIMLSPAFWPTIITAVISLMGVLLMIPERIKPETDGKGDHEDDENRTPWKTRIPRLMVITVVLFGFYFFIEQLGMVVPGIIIIFFLMVFAGYRRWWLMVMLSILVPVILYLFFVNVANIPIPLGVFESWRG
ncbi:tripartite tricarboxylate transporter TctB family protein [Cocleimonas sp. KMM 6892]|uniref:tripartite tricarboxylate transporter TctB family protein n=1 Tax=unclassified Cocleimonas TaxID=2639732 RepID=UPI002DB9793F|nr:MULTISPECIES: tripartite tricarboxylate transporter TctB family protein [unclassified Cocleimonas]MEB8431746.1 tripartite tricarboxylate transporter TctB family protein [Cocleimonas sp. KMM 6892]MEC4715168.1 tripartite tricarboxylate transporter TctB family protein [Cocleimonas sp. KMM 6895]MEC4744018.1 tripartite tricarboxylate transporter TctB family protein [Cocleimonas sp. KMM 6896]